MSITTGLTWNATYPQDASGRNGDGTRVETTLQRGMGPTVPTRYTLDPSASLRAGLAAPLVTVLQAQNAIYGTVVITRAVQYVYGQGDSPLASYDGAWRYLSGRDGLNSVRQETDAAGKPVVTRSFDPYGVPLGEDGGHPFGYTGEQWDNATGLVFLRARMYQPGLGIFLSRDAWEGNALQPLTYNGWTYVEGNPVNFTDPSGYCHAQRVAYMTYTSDDGGFNGTLSLHIVEKLLGWDCPLWPCGFNVPAIPMDDSWPARSGARDLGYGPIPPDDYLVDPVQIRPNLSVPRYNWGLFRLCLKSEDGQDTDYCIHGGHAGGTAGCIKVNNEDLPYVLIRILGMAQNQFDT